MINYQEIAPLVNQIPADTWEILRGIKERWPAMMLSELIDCRRGALQQQTAVESLSPQPNPTETIAI
jgi:hypothetical protein